MIDNLTYSSLHNHSEYSNLRLIDSINRASELMDYGKELGLHAIAITDHECLSGSVKALQYWEEKYKDSGFKLILGNEIYLSREGLTLDNYESGEKFYHFILLAKDKEGFHQLRQLSSAAWKRGFMKNMLRVPTYPSDLFKFVKGGHLVCTTACLGGYTAEMWKNYAWDKDEQWLAKMDNFCGMIDDLFGHENFYIELQPSHQPEQIEYNKFMIERYWGKYNFTFATDSHYLKKEEKQLHHNFLNSKQSKERETDSFYSSAYMMSINEVWDYFKDYISEDKFITMANNTNAIADMCESYELKEPQIVPRVVYEPVEDGREVFFELDKEKYPTIHYFLNAEDPADNYFMQLIANGYINKFQDTWDFNKYYKEIEIELDTIKQISEKIGKSLSDYFITMAKMIDLMWDADSLVGPSRGSAGAMLINYLIGITQMNPLEQELELPFWRFLHPSRPDMPDIDVDTESFKRQKVFNKVQDYFRSIGGDVVNVCTFGTEGTKSAIKTAARGLNIDADVVTYITSMIPNERGFDWSLDDCYYGTEERPKIKAFIEQMTAYPDLWKLAHRIEGLVTRLGVHASGVVCVNGDFTDRCSFMKTQNGQLVTAFELHDTEAACGLIKYDFLTVSALDRIHQTLNYLLEDKVIEWQGSLRRTYNKYLHPDVIDYKSKEMWDMVGKGEISSLFQFDTIVGSQAILRVKPQSLTELAIANSVLRLMCDGETPLETYAKYKENINLWYKELEPYNFSEEEIKVLEKHLLKLSGVADSQESVMMMSMDPHISNFSMAEANKLRKTIAKKKFREIEAMKELFFEKGKEAGTNINLLSYIWYVQISRQLGYSFSSIHTTGYSILAVQEMNLAYHYPIIYWNTACLCVDSSAINDEDFESLITEGIVESAEFEDRTTQNKMDYAKMANAVDKFRRTTNIELPDINESRLGFTPDVAKNSILYGLKGISRITQPVIEEIMANRPFTSLADFQNKVTKKICTKDKIVNLIKCGAFNEIEHKTTREVLEMFLGTTADQKKKLTLQNANMLIDKDLIPDEPLKYNKMIYKLTKELRKHRDLNRMYYILNDVMVDENDKESWLGALKEHATIEYVDVDGRPGLGVIDSALWDKYYDSQMLYIKQYINSNHDDLLLALNKKLFDEELMKYGGGKTELDWELDSVNFYHSGHPLAKVVPTLPIQITPINMIKDGDQDGWFTIKGQKVPRMKIYSIAGTVIDKNKTKGLVTIQTLEGVVDIKIYKDLFATFMKVVKDDDDNILEDSFFEKGTHLIVTGILRGTTFIPKVYKNMNMKTILKIELDEDGNFKNLIAKGD